MAADDQANIANLLLRQLAPADFELLRPHLALVDLIDGNTLTEPDMPISYSWFPESGVCSLIASTPAGRNVEVGLIGRDGLVDSAIMHGTDRTPLLCFVQIAGGAWRMRSDALLRAAENSPGIDNLLKAYAQTLFVQVAHTALANASHSIGQRLARWLLMSGDRIDGRDVRLTHERLSLMLGVRRAGVTVAVQALERSGLIAARRGIISVIDRDRLLRYAEDSYGTPEAEYERLIGVPIK